MVKNPPANAGDTSSIPGWERSPGEGNGNPLRDSCLESSIEEPGVGLGGGYSPRGRKELEATEHAHSQINKIKECICRAALMLCVFRTIKSE